MGICKHCGNKAGLFSTAHTECQNKYDDGIKDFTTALRSYFFGSATIKDVLSCKDNLIKHAYLKEDDVCNLSITVIMEYIGKIKMPYTPCIIDKVDTYINSIGLSFSKINRTGVLNDFSKKIIGGYYVDYFLDKSTLSQAQSNCQRLLQRFPLSVSDQKNAYLLVLDKAAKNYLKNGFLSQAEKSKIENYINCLGLQINNLPAQFKDSDIVKISQSLILGNLQKGIVPKHNFQLPILLTKGENLLWVYNDAELFMEKVEREWVGRSGGFSFRIMRGVYYRVGQSKGKPIEHSHMQSYGKGSLFVTSKNLIFYSAEKSVKIPYSKLVGITPYSDGIEIHKENSKRMAIQGLDPWFIMNYVQNCLNY